MNTTENNLPTPKEPKSVLKPPPPPVPVFDPKLAVPLETPVRHKPTAKTVHFVQDGHGYTLAGKPIGPMPKGFEVVKQLTPTERAAQRQKGKPETAASAS